MIAPNRYSVLMDVLQLRSSKRERADLFYSEPLFTRLSSMSVQARAQIAALAHVAAIDQKSITSLSLAIDRNIARVETP